MNRPAFKKTVWYYVLCIFLRDPEQETCERPDPACIALAKKSGMPAAAWRRLCANVGCESCTFVS